MGEAYWEKSLNSAGGSDKEESAGISLFMAWLDELWYFLAIYYFVVSTTSV